MSPTRRIQVGLGIAGVVVVLLTLVIGVRAFEGGNLSKARRIAAQLQADALAHPNSIGTATPTVGSLVATPTPGTSPATTTPTSHSKTPTTNAAAKATAPAAAVSPPTTAKAGVGVQVAAPAITKTAVKVISTSTIAPWRQPTTAEVDEAISAVHSLVPFFTPTPTQIADSGIQVCIAFDQGQSFSTVESDALNMIGASSYSWAIPQSAQVTAIETLVALYCPANAAKLPS